MKRRKFLQTLPVIAALPAGLPASPLLPSTEAEKLWSEVLTHSASIICRVEVGVRDAEGKMSWQEVEQFSPSNNTLTFKNQRLL